MSASFDAGAEVVQHDVYARDGVGRVVSVVDEALATRVVQCYSYDGFNRLEWAWTDIRTTNTCGGDWSDAVQPTGADEALGYALNYGYSASGRIDEVWAATLDVAPEFDDGVLADYGYDDVDLPHAVTSVDDGETDSFTYDDAGRMITRSVDDGDTLTDDEMTLTWDESSNLVATGSATGNRVYVYDASGQRVAQIAVSELTPAATPISATIYVGDAEGTDANTAPISMGAVSATRFITFGGATVATITATATVTSWSLLFGDVQGSARVSMPLVPDTAETTGLEPSSTSHTPTHDAYLPYGAERGDTDLAIDRGWLGQYEDTDTGLTYLNARYYDPELGRFLSPDPLMNPGDPKTLDPYMYAANNPVTYTDTSGLCYNLTGQNLIDCANGSRLSVGSYARALDSVKTGAVHKVQYVPGSSGRSTTYGALFIEQVSPGFDLTAGACAFGPLGCAASATDFKSRGDGRGPSPSRSVVTTESRLSWWFDSGTGVLDVRENSSCDDQDGGTCHAPLSATIDVRFGVPDESLALGGGYEETPAGRCAGATLFACRPAADITISFSGKNSATTPAALTPSLDAQIRINFLGNGRVWTGVYGDNFPSAEAYVERGGAAARILYDDASQREPGLNLAVVGRGIYGATGMA